MEFTYQDETRGGTKAAPKTVVEAVAAQLREDILSGQLAPGSKLRVETLRDHYGFGSSTLREALLRLASGALVTMEGQRGFQVAGVSLEDFKQICDMRKLLETDALAKSIERGDDQWEAEIVGAFHWLSKIEEKVRQKSADTTSESDPSQTLFKEWEHRNRAFHRALISRCENRWLLDFRSTLLDHAGRYLRLSLTDRTIPRDGHAEHQAILDATLARDTETACRLTRDHIDRTITIILAMAEQWDRPETNGDLSRGKARS